jgi:hypothetical protein
MMDMIKGGGMFDDTKQDDGQTVSVAHDATVADAQADDAATQSNTSSNSSSSNDELLEIKRSALQELSPLIDHLDQEPEERFQTTMMMIQATDDKELIPKAYEAAKQIKEDKDRAQALLDIVNEINYFTQDSKQQTA